MLDASKMTLLVFVLTLAFALPLGMLVAVGRMSKIKIISWIIQAYLLVMRGTPLILQLIFFYFAPDLIGIHLTRFQAAIVAFTLNYAAYFAEIYRGGIESVPLGQREAANVLGLSRTHTFFRIVLPLVKPALASIGMFVALNYWNEWRTGMLFLQDDTLFPLQYYLYRLLNSVEFLKNATTAMSSNISSMDFPSESLKLAMTVIATGPIILLYPFLQKYFVKGITIGAVKG